ncbi:MAG: hypothetical protein K2M03_06535 [Muribaculaceae bacterium]|nr:hypothetical protein [Muribaculaceae bacterium]
MMRYDEAKELLEAYPAFTYAALCMYRTTADEKERERLRGRLAATIGSRADLREILGVDSASLTDFYQDALPQTLSTSDTISTFIERFTPSAPPVSDYLASIESMTPLSQSQTEVDGESETMPDDERVPKVSDGPEISEKYEAETSGANDSAVDVEPVAPSPLTESFARILIKNGNYKKALEIISELNLKNSEKSIYFADQIRFLKKLIAIESAGR